MIDPSFRTFVDDELRGLTLDAFPFDDLMGRFTVTCVEIDIEAPADPDEARRRRETWGVRRHVTVDISVRREDGFATDDDDAAEATTHRRRWDLGVIPALGADGILVVDGEDHRLDAPDIGRPLAERYLELLRSQALQFARDAVERAALALSREFLELSAFDDPTREGLVPVAAVAGRKRLVDLARRIGSLPGAVALPGIELDFGLESWFAAVHERVELPFGAGMLIVSPDPNPRGHPRDSRPDGARKSWYVRWMATDRRRLGPNADAWGEIRRSWGYPVIVVDDEDGAVYARFGEGWKLETVDGTVYAMFGDGWKTRDDWVRIEPDLDTFFERLAEGGAGYWLHLGAWQRRVNQAAAEEERRRACEDSGWRHFLDGAADRLPPSPRPVSIVDGDRSIPWASSAPGATLDEALDAWRRAGDPRAQAWAAADVGTWSRAMGLVLGRALAIAVDDLACACLLVAIGEPVPLSLARDLQRRLARRPDVPTEVMFFLLSTGSEPARPATGGPQWCGDLVRRLWDLERDDEVPEAARRQFPWTADAEVRMAGPFVVAYHPTPREDADQVTIGEPSSGRAVRFDAVANGMASTDPGDWMGDE